MVVHFNCMSQLSSSLFSTNRHTAIGLQDSANNNTNIYAPRALQLFKQSSSSGSKEKLKEMAP